MISDDRLLHHHKVRAGLMIPVKISDKLLEQWTDILGVSCSGNYDTIRMTKKSADCSIISN
jgi:hypothetical protein